MFKLKRKKSKVNKEDEENINLLRNSKYFDEDYYKLMNPKLKTDPCTHYYFKGWKKGKSPSYEFSTTYYLEHNQDVKDSGINPLLHYLKNGQFEERKIQKDIGLPLNELYEKQYNFTYFYKIWEINDENKRLNLFFDKIDENISQIKNLFKFIINFSEKKNYTIRIVYNEADFYNLNKFLKKNNLKLPKDTIFINLKKDNYLEINENDLYMTTSWKSTLALLRNKLINKNIYFYIDNFTSKDMSERYYYTKACTNAQVICLSENKAEINGIELIFTTNNEKIKFPYENVIYCDFNNLTMIGVEFINNLFKNNNMSKKWNLKLLKTKKIEKFYLDNGIEVKICKKIGDDVSLLVSCLKNENLNYNYPVLNIDTETKKYELNNYINILKEDSINKINNETLKTCDDENEYLKFVDKINSIIK